MRCVSLLLISVAASRADVSVHVDAHGQLRVAAGLQSGAAALASSCSSTFACSRSALSSPILLLSAALMRATSASSAATDAKKASLDLEEQLEWQNTLVNDLALDHRRLNQLVVLVCPPIPLPLY